MLKGKMLNVSERLNLKSSAVLLHRLLVLPATLKLPKPVSQLSIAFHWLTMCLKYQALKIHVSLLVWVKWKSACTPLIHYSYMYQTQTGLGALQTLHGSPLWAFTWKSNSRKIKQKMLATVQDKGYNVMSARMRLAFLDWWGDKEFMLHSSTCY